MKNLYKLVCCLCLVIFSTAGCKTRERVEYTFLPEETEQIVIQTDGQNINLVSTEEEQIKISMDSKDKWVAELKDGTLTVNIPAASGIINLKTQTLQVELPVKIYDTINLITAAGNIEADNIQASGLSVKTDSGNITVKDMEGNVDAQSNSGKIKSSLPAAPAITPKDGGYILKGKIGTEKDDTSNIKFKSVSGTITID